MVPVCSIHKLPTKRGTISTLMGEIYQYLCMYVAMPGQNQYTSAIKFPTVTCMLKNNVFTKSILALTASCGLK